MRIKQWINKRLHLEIFTENEWEDSFTWKRWSEFHIINVSWGKSVLKFQKSLYFTLGLLGFSLRFYFTYETPTKP